MATLAVSLSPFSRGGIGRAEGPRRSVLPRSRDADELTELKVLAIQRNEFQPSAADLQMVAKRVRLR